MIVCWWMCRVAIRECWAGGRRWRKNPCRVGPPMAATGPDFGRIEKSARFMAKKLYIETVGCQMNVLDSELVVGGLRREGYELTDSPTDADLILFNTCSV